ncbi:MAG: DNA translocase FtsK [Clostridiaceae bacterium]|nr:DNA translocase FtsK [Clostridiaceae bacterium]
MEIKGIIFIAIGLLTSVAMYTSLAGFLSMFIQRVGKLLFGVGCYIVPIYLLYLGYRYLKGRGNIEVERKFYGITIYTIILVLFCGTIFVQGIDKNISFGDSTLYIINSVAEGLSGVHGGILANIVSFPLYKLIGAIGSYIIYIALFIIASIITFNFSPIKAGAAAKAKGIEYREREREKRKKAVEKKRDEFINVKEQPSEEKSSKEDFLKGVNHKIKILDFMKNSTLDEEEDFNISENLNKPVSELAPEMTFPEKKTKSKNLDNDIKDVVSKEIDYTINNSQEKHSEYVFPRTSLLNYNSKTKLNSEDKKDLIEHANKLEETLGSFGVEAKVNQVTKGPSVTRFELQPSPGVKVSKIINLADDIALGLAASGVRIEAPIPGKSAVGIEVPNNKQTPVFLREVLDSNEFKNSKGKLAFALGKDIGGSCVVGDLSKMPHTLIAGATGSGKSVCINSLIISLLYKYSPDEVKLLLVDPKVVELNVYNGIPHLLIPVVTDPKKAAAALNWAVNEMTKRYNLFAEKGVRNIDSYNALFDKDQITEKLPYTVIIVDELADLMMACANDVEDYICRLAQMARAAGMHLVIATQRPSVDVITGVIKSNIPSRISFAVSSQVDSRTILDSSGAEKLLGKGDMLYAPVGENKPLRVQGCFISEEEVESVINFIKEEHNEVQYEESILEHINSESQGENSLEAQDDVDELLSQAINLVVEYEQASTSFLQRRLRIGFNRASRIMDQLEERGIISEKDGSRPRQVLVTKEQLMNSSEKEDEN